MFVLYGNQAYQEGDETYDYSMNPIFQAGKPGQKTGCQLASEQKVVISSQGHLSSLK
jgi:hypothetical protein